MSEETTLPMESLLDAAGVPTASEIDGLDWVEGGLKITYTPPEDGE